MTCITRFVVAIACLSMVACTTLQPVALDQAASPAVVVEHGDLITIGRRDGTTVEAYVVSSDAQGVTLKELKTDRGLTVPWSEIARVQRAEFSTMKTLGAAAIVFLILGVIAFSSGPYGY